MSVCNCSGGATVLAFVLGVFFGGLASLVVLRARDDFIVDASDDLFDGLAGIRFTGFGAAGFAGFRTWGRARPCQVFQELARVLASAEGSAVGPAPQAPGSPGVTRRRAPRAQLDFASIPSPLSLALPLKAEQYVSQNNGDRLSPLDFHPEHAAGIELYACTRAYHGDEFGRVQGGLGMEANSDARPLALHGGDAGAHTWI